ncbi:MBL fold metallo-hydrolase [Ferdinandcohnia quinoae]|uniref:MBL fold metallo-hydrolase n=1 Tax=Fredinandcohnia quinoae TaxID=2918902 RepID=A0AAW5E0E6_9BACI|nr:MBL fold metallo-hydrolase [Fredinandcohnia sp. SECRCQ15]MCH1626385.1 MBL fold metallo-hydrolase [Fredinandcohnia sp. SECRCQ15]
MENENTLEDNYLPVTSITSGIGQAILPDIFCLPIQIVNVCFVGTKDDWVLVDAGMPQSADDIIEAAKEQFGENTRPNAIILTHAHFDHVGAIEKLIEIWDIPVYAHMKEIPYLTGKANYPEGDPTVSSGLVAKMSPMFPNHGINIGSHVHVLPEDHSVPYMEGWAWTHTPGHTPGHVSFFREDDGALIVGDAFVTVKQESLFKVMVQKQEISGPPKYFTPDWVAAKQSVIKLEKLKPKIAVTGHGLPMSGEELTTALATLVRDFDDIALPKNSHFVN